MKMTEEDAKRHWSQDELKDHLRKGGWSEADLAFEIIPQGAKYISFEPLTPEDIAWGQEIARAIAAGEIKPLNIRLKRRRIQ